MSWLINALQPFAKRKGETTEDHLERLSAHDGANPVGPLSKDLLELLDRITELEARVERLEDGRS